MAQETRLWPGARQGLRPEQLRAGDAEPQHAALLPGRLARPGRRGLQGGQRGHRLFLTSRLSGCYLDTNGFQLHPSAERGCAFTGAVKDLKLQVPPWTLWAWKTVF